MKFLDPLDSAFILLETPGTAMNIGAVIELEASKDEDASTRFEEIRKNVAARIHEIPVLTQKVVRTPFDVTWPLLVRDERFDIDRHLVRVALPSPGNQQQFDALASDFFSRNLSPQRPLWQLLVIEGLESGRLGLALKVHHALADGVSGAETFASLFDISPEVRSPVPRLDPDVTSERSVNSLGLFRFALRRLLTRPSLVIEGISSWSKRLAEVLAAVIRVISLHSKRHARELDQPSIFEARRTTLNAAPAIEKIYCRSRVELETIKRAARSEGASVTDFVMCAVSGALRRLVEFRGETLRRDLVAFVPINVRAEGESAALGNQFSGVLIRLHSDQSDPKERLRAISADASRSVGSQRLRRAKIFQDAPRVMGPTVLSLGAKLLSMFSLFERLPMANVMISSVPGPPIALWLSGHRVVSASPVGPLVGSLSLNITALGFEDHLEFGLLGCAEQMSDLEMLRDYLSEEIERLHQALRD